MVCLVIILYESGFIELNLLILLYSEHFKKFEVFTFPYRFGLWFNFPTDLATKMDTVASPVTFTTVRHISSGRSTAKIRAKLMAILSEGKPLDSKTITNITIPAPGTAAEPIDASNAVKIIVS